MHYFSSHSNGIAGPSICIADGIVERYDHIRSHYASWGLSPCVPYVIVDLVCSLSSMPGMVLFFGMFSGLEGRQFLVRRARLLTANIGQPLIVNKILTSWSAGQPLWTCAVRLSSRHIRN